MKKLLLSLFVLASVTMMQAVSVKFQVLVPKESNGCYIAGAFNGWSHQEMTFVAEDEETKAYTLEVEVADPAVLDPALGDYGYKYASGPSWDYVEKDINGGEVSNRKWTEEETDIVANWLSVYDPALQPGHGRIILKGLPAYSGEDVYVVGKFGANNPDFPEWTPGNENMKMVKQADGSYLLDIPGDITSQPYKFVCGASWDFEEQKENGEGVSDKIAKPGDNIVEAVIRWKAIPDGAKFNVTTPATTEVCYFGDVAGLNFSKMYANNVPDTVPTRSFSLPMAKQYVENLTTYLYYAGNEVKYVEEESAGIAKTPRSFVYAPGGVNIDDVVTVFKEEASSVDNVKGISFNVFSTNGIISAIFEGAASIQLFDISGKMIQSTQGVDTYNISGLTQGLYILKINNEVAKVSVR